MTTRAGTIYKPQEKIAETQRTADAFEEMMKQLIEDRRRQDERYAAERAEREKQYAAERSAMRSQMDVLMKLVGETAKARSEPLAGRLLGGVPQVKLV